MMAFCVGEPKWNGLIKLAVVLQLYCVVPKSGDWAMAIHGNHRADGSRDPHGRKGFRNC